MSILLLLIPLSLVLLVGAIWAFAWAVRSGQFDDLETPAIDILAEDRHDPDHHRPDHHSPDHHAPDHHDNGG